MRSRFRRSSFWPCSGGARERLREQVAKLKELRKEDQDELSRLRADINALVRVVNQSTLEHRQLYGVDSN
ncbi:hypothetical protein ACQPZZ_13165 [Microbispora sp. CA-135349]|uniref:hypothetical protein n=1 Tax=Microbispora sp. CA-135349 TaxID=3239953 RepID=UPI003D8EBB08